MGKLKNFLYKALRISNDINAVVNPDKLPRRLKNKVVGRALNRIKFWR